MNRYFFSFADTFASKPELALASTVSGFIPSGLWFGRSVISDSLWPHGLQHARLLCPWHFPEKNAGVGCHFLLQGILPTQGSNPGLLHWQAGSLLSEPPGKPTPSRRIPEVGKLLLFYVLILSSLNLAQESRRQTCIGQSEVAPSCPTLSNPLDCSPPGSSVHGILQARILEWVAISFPTQGSNPGLPHCGQTL